jgi:hypothetical protein
VEFPSLANEFSLNRKAFMKNKENTKYFDNFCSKRTSKPFNSRIKIVSELESSSCGLAVGMNENPLTLQTQFTSASW